MFYIPEGEYEFEGGEGVPVEDVDYGLERDDGYGGGDAREDMTAYGDDDDLLLMANPRMVARIAKEGGLGSNIFNRNERLDVKKPGPFFKNSANNFFLDKVSL